ncbi:MAG TPA: hypothetical protein VG711_09985, partial [Phycisphaerales bacterium]|nr:hypothetical protein [Phycisphaerales bacterium]
TRASEPHESGSRIAARLAPDSDLDPDPAIQSSRQAFEDRDAIGKKYLGQLKSLLNPEQFAELPGAVQVDGSRRSRRYQPDQNGHSENRDHESPGNRDE